MTARIVNSRVPGGFSITPGRLALGGVSDTAEA